MSITHIDNYFKAVSIAIEAAERLRLMRLVREAHTTNKRRSPK